MEERGRITGDAQQVAFRRVRERHAIKWTMAGTFVDVRPETLSNLSAEEAVGLFRMLLWCAVRRHGIPLNSVTVTARVNVADGGIDAEVAPNAVVPQEDLTCSPKTDPGVMRVYRPCGGKETLDEAQEA